MPFVSSVRGSFGLQKRPFPRLTINSTNSTITGGSITTAGGYRIHTFTSGTTDFSYTYSGGNTNGATITFPVEILAVGGGGSGGGHHGGGGGGGGVITGTINISSQTTSVTVGSHGVGAGSSVSNTRDFSYNGGNSSIGSRIAYGGGAGQTCCGRGAPGYAAEQGLPGGSSGGCGAQTSSNRTSAAITQISGSDYTGYGNVGGSISTNSSSHASSGGGGAGSVGGNGVYTSNSCRNGNGGNGIASSISGSSVTYAGGGGGGQHTGTACWSGGLGGSGGGGNGPNTGGANSDGGSGTNGTDGLGGGGGGDSHSGGGGTRGGSGVVIMRYLA